MGWLARMAGWLDDRPNEKTVYPRQNQDYPIGPGGVTGDDGYIPPTPPWGELRPRGIPLSQLATTSADMSGAAPQGAGGYAGGMQPDSAGGAPPIDEGMEMRLAMQRARLFPRPDPMLDWYRAQGEQDLGDLRRRRDDYSWQAQDAEARLGRLPPRR